MLRYLEQKQEQKQKQKQKHGQSHSVQAQQASSMAEVDYQRRPLKAGGALVDSFCVSCLLAEDALCASLKYGNSALAAKHLKMENVSMTLDGLGVRPVKVHEENRLLAVVIAKRVRADLWAHGLNLRAAKVQVNNAKGKKAGDHDMVCDVCTGPYGAVPDERTPNGWLSGELRCRRLRKEAGLVKFRQCSHDESDLKLDWWQRILKEDVKETWSGRFILLVNFDQDLSYMTTKADVRLVGQNYKGFWGWAGSCNFIQLPPARIQAPSAAAQPRPRGAQPERLERPARLTWEQINRKLKYEKRYPPTPNAAAVNVAPLNRLFELIPMSINQNGEKVKVAKRKHEWTDLDIFKLPRTSGKKGGKNGWLAKEQVLKQMYADYK